MSRIRIKKSLQAKFLANLEKGAGIDWVKFSSKLNISPRTVLDWRRGKYTISESTFKLFLKLAKGRVRVPPYSLLPDFWSVAKAAKMGGLVTAERHGGPGTAEGRRKGGKISQERRKLHPELYKQCILRKKILKPPDTAELAEFFGIVLGDGGINSDYQVVISLHKKNDKEYAYFVSNLINKLFGIKPALYSYHGERVKNVTGVTISSKSVVEFLLSKGLKKGSKVRQQVGVPAWIRGNFEFSKSCLRGLVDTDGGLYYHRHRSNGCRCFNIGLQFTSSSSPILNFTDETFKKLGFNSRVYKNHVNLYREPEIRRYAEKIKFSNTYHSKRLNNFYKIKALEVK